MTPNSLSTAFMDLTLEDLRMKENRCRESNGGDESLDKLLTFSQYLKGKLSWRLGASNNFKMFRFQRTIKNWIRLILKSLEYLIISSNHHLMREHLMLNKVCIIKHKHFNHLSKKNKILKIIQNLKNQMRVMTLNMF